MSAPPLPLEQAARTRPRPELARGRRRGPGFTALLGAALGLALAFLVLPMLAIFLHAPPGRLIASLGNREAVQSLLLSLRTSAIAMAAVVLVGTPAAYLLARGRLPARTLVLTLIELPLVLPPAVAGIALLAALGPHGVLGGALAALHVQLVLRTAGVVVALAFVSAPFYLRQAQSAFQAIDRTYLDAARALGARESATFLRVAVPIARPGLAAGLALAWGRALGEFGATLLFAGSFEGVTQTAPLAIYDLFPTDFRAALALSAVLLLVSAGVLLSVKLLARSAADV